MNRNKKNRRSKNRKNSKKTKMTKNQFKRISRMDNNKTTNMNRKTHKSSLTSPANKSERTCCSRARNSLKRTHRKTATSRKELRRSTAP